MPVDVTSRYWTLKSYEVTSDGRTTSALPIRILEPEEQEDVYNHRLTGVETIEFLGWRHYGRSTAWWRIADANPLAFPLDYRPGSTVRLPPPSHTGRVLRTRSF